MNKAEYQEYLKSDHWQEVRKTALELADNHCALCCGRDNLQVHHNNYENLGEEREADLVVLCDKCHAKFHGKGEAADVEADIKDVEQLICYTVKLVEKITQFRIPLSNKIGDAGFQLDWYKAMLIGQLVELVTDDIVNTIKTNSIVDEIQKGSTE